jgi:nitrate/nitrite transporter NarK
MLPDGIRGRLARVSRPRGGGWRVAAGGVGLGLSAGWNLSNVGAIAEATAQDYRVSLAVVGIFTTALFVMHGAMQLPAGRLVDRLGARRVGLAGLALVTACNAAALISPAPTLALAMRTLAGIGTAICFVAGSDYVRASGGGAFAQGVFGAAGVGGGGLALAVVPQVARFADWRASFGSAAVVALCGAVALLLGSSDRHRSRPVAGGAAGSLWTDPRLLRLAVVHTGTFGLSVLVGDWVVTLLERAGGLSSGVAGLVGSLTLLLGIGSRPLGGWLLRARPEWTSHLVTGSIAAGAIGTAVLVAARPLPLAIAASALIGIASGLPFAYVFSSVPRVRPDAPAAAIGVVNAYAVLVILVGNPLLGLSFSAPGDGRIGFAVVVALWLAVLAAVRR